MVPGSETVESEGDRRANLFLVGGGLVRGPPCMFSGKRSLYPQVSTRNVIVGNFYSSLVKFGASL